MKTTPGTSLSVLLVWAVLAYGLFVTLPQLAYAKDVQAQAAATTKLEQSAKSIEASVASLNTRLQLDGMRRAIDSIDGELGAVNREIARARTGGGEAAEYLLDRHRQLTNRRAELQDKLAALTRTNPDLVYQ